MQKVEKVLRISPGESPSSKEFLARISREILPHIPDEKHLFSALIAMAEIIYTYGDEDGFIWFVKEGRILRLVVGNKRPEKDSWKTQAVHRQPPEADTYLSIISSAVKRIQEEDECATIRIEIEKWFLFEIRYASTIHHEDSISFLLEKWPA
jgi:hypothetical protein